MTYQDDFKVFEEQMFALAKMARDSDARDRSLFVLSSSVRRLRRLLKAVEHEMDWAVMAFLDGWPGTPEGYNNEVSMSIYRPTDSDRYEQHSELRQVPGYDTAQYVSENGEPIEIKPFGQRSASSNAHKRALKHAKEVIEHGYREADYASPAATGWGNNQVVTESQLLTWYDRGTEHRQEEERKAEHQRIYAERRAEDTRKAVEGRAPSKGWSLFDWETGERIAPATNEQYESWTRPNQEYGQGQMEPGPPDQPIMVSWEDPTILTHRGWRYDTKRVKQGRKWIYAVGEPYADPGERPVRVGPNELAEGLKGPDRGDRRQDLPAARQSLGTVKAS